MKFYIEIDDKNSNAICGSIYTKNRDKRQEIYLYFNAGKIDKMSYWLKVKNYKTRVEEGTILYVEDAGKMNGKNILYFVENFMKDIYSRDVWTSEDIYKKLCRDGEFIF